MDEKTLNEVALFRYKVISPLIEDAGQFDSDHAFFMLRSKDTFIDPIKKEKVKISDATIERWYYCYKKSGFDALKPKRRQDFGIQRKVNGEMIDEVQRIITENPRIPATLLKEKLDESGSSNCSLSTINRLKNMIKSSLKTQATDQMLRYERKHINDVWCGDTTVIWANSVAKKPQKLYIIAFIDDASRKIVGAKVYENDNLANLVDCMKCAVSSNGIPMIFNFDNGKNYASKQMEIIAGRLGCGIHYCAPYTPTAKAKIERWFRTLKDHRTANNLKTLDEIQNSLNTYVNKYNSTVHSSLDNMSPVDRFNQELDIVRYLPKESCEKSFYFEEERKVSQDSVVKVHKEHLFQTDFRYQNKRVNIVFTPDYSKVFIRDGENLVPINPLNKTANSTSVRTRIGDIVKGENHD